METPQDSVSVLWHFQSKLNKILDIQNCNIVAILKEIIVLMERVDHFLNFLFVWASVQADSQA